MTWFRVDDTLAMHPKVVAAGNTAMGLWLRAGAWSAQQLTDGHVPRNMLAALGAKPRDARALVDAGLWIEVSDGWSFHQWTERQPTRAEVQDERKCNATRAALHRDPELREAVKRRDRGRCRYCGLLVDWKDRRSARGGTYDHVLARGENTLDNLVVACRGCNSRKGDRTPQEAGMPLLDPGSLGSSSSPVLEPTQNISSPRPDPTRPREQEPPAGTASPPAAAPPTLVEHHDAGPAAPTTVAQRDLGAQALVAEWIDHCGERPPGRVVGQVAREVGAMLGEGVPPADVRRGLAAWHAKRLHPSALASVVHETRLGPPTAAVRPAPSDVRAAQNLALVATYAAREGLPLPEIGA